MMMSLEKEARIRDWRLKAIARDAGAAVRRRLPGHTGLGRPHEVRVRAGQARRILGGKPAIGDLNELVRSVDTPRMRRALDEAIPGRAG